MRNILRGIFPFMLAMLVLFVSTATAELVIDQNYQLVSKTRVGRTAYDYTYHLNITNNGDVIAANVSATVTSGSTNTTVIDGSVNFGNVEAGATVTGSDIFTFRQNRRYAFDPSDLSWDISDDKLRIKNVTPPAALPGASVTVKYSGACSGVPLEAVLNGHIINTTTSPDNPDSVCFVIPDGVKSNTLYLRQEGSYSNAVYFSVSNISVVTPGPEDIALDELGNEVAVNLLLISMKDGFYTVEEAQRALNLVGGIIVGRIPIILAYQIKLPTTTLEELRAAKNILKNDPAIRFVMEDQKIGNSAAAWDPLPEELTHQRDSNDVENGAELYSEWIDPNVVNMSSYKIHPMFTSIGIVESGVDFDAADFDGYAGIKRPNNIAIYANDLDDYTDKNGKLKKAETQHGTTVTGMVAAELGDGDKDSGKNSGLLQGLGNSHGGFNIRVSLSEPISDTGEVLEWDGKNNANTWAHSYITTIEAMLEDGSRIINCSFGVYPKGACDRTGEEITINNVVDPDFFDEWKKAFDLFFTELPLKYPDAVIVAAAGNADALVRKEDSSPAGNSSENMIVVGAHTPEATPVRDVYKNKPYSDYGNQVDIAAAGTVQTSLKDINRPGTSFAAPLVTATIAAMRSINPDLTPNEIKKLLRRSASPIFDNDVKNVSGDNIAVFTMPIAPDEVGFYDIRLQVGHGARLNVKNAIQAAIDSVGEKTIPTGDGVAVILSEEESQTVDVPVTVPEDYVFDKVDILFMVDVSGSYGDDIAQFKSKAVDIVNAFQTAGRDVQIGLSTFSDFPFSPYGGYTNGDYAYQLDQPLTNEFSEVISAINSISLHWGADGPESQLEALYQAATGRGRTIPDKSYADIAPSSVGWRSGSLPIIFLATDYSFHKENSYPGANWAETLSELTSRGISVYGLQAGGSITDVEQIANETGGESFTLSRNSSEIVSAILAALEEKPVDIQLVQNGDFADTIQSITTVDGSEEGYKDVSPGETKIFKVTFRTSNISEQPVFTDEEQIFAFRLVVKAKDVATIMEIPVTVTIPSLY